MFSIKDFISKCDQMWVYFVSLFPSWLFIYLFINLLNLFINLLIYLFINLFIDSFTYSLIHPCIHSFKKLIRNHPSWKIYPTHYVIPSLIFFAMWPPFKRTERQHPVDTECKLNVHKTFRRRPGRLLNVLCTFNSRPVSTGEGVLTVWQTSELMKSLDIWRYFILNLQVHRLWNR